MKKNIELIYIFILINIQFQFDINTRAGKG